MRTLEKNNIRKERDSKEQEYVKYITCRDDVEEYIYCYGGYYYPVPSIDNVISYVYPVDSIKVDGKVTYLSREGSKYHRAVRTAELPELTVGESVVIAESYGHMYKVIQTIRKEEENMRDLKTEVSRDVLYGVLRQVLRDQNQSTKTLRKGYDVVYFVYGLVYFSMYLTVDDNNDFKLYFKGQEYSGNIVKEGSATYDSSITLAGFKSWLERLVVELTLEDWYNHTI